MLLDVIRSNRSLIAKGMTAQERETEGRLARAASSIDSQLYRENLMNASSQQRLDFLGSKLNAARSAYDDFEAGLYKAHPELAAYRAAPVPVERNNCVWLWKDSPAA